MSRAALWRQEANKKSREQLAESTFQTALSEGRSRPTKGLIPLKDPSTDSFSLNPMLLNNISKGAYFQKACDRLKSWTAVVDEIYYEVTHLEPWALGAARTPSTAFSLLLRLLTIRCTIKEMNLMLNHVDSPFIRCIGFLYLRYAADPSVIWDYFKPYLYDEEIVRIRANVKCPESTVGEFVRGLLTDLEYYGTRLPRFPVALEREMKVKLLQEERVEERAQLHLRNDKRMEYFQKVGSRVRALYGDEENPVTWYDAVVDRVWKKDDVTGVEFYRPKFVVTFPEYGNTETVSLGEMDLPGGGDDRGRSDRGDRNRDRDRDRGRGYDERPRNGGGYSDERYHSRRDHRDRGREDAREDSRRRGYSSRGYEDYRSCSGSGSGSDRRYRHGNDHNYGRNRNHERSPARYRDRSRSRSRDRDRAVPDKQDLMEEVLRRERESTTASGRGNVVRPPPTLKRSLESTNANGNHGDRYRYKNDSVDDYDHSSKSFKSQHHSNGMQSRKHNAGVEREFSQEMKEKKAPVKKTPEELAAIAEKKRKLMAKYG